MAAVKLGSVKFYFLTPRFDKPDKTYEELIVQAFEAKAPGARLSIDEICIHVLNRYDYFRDKIRSLKGCIRYVGVCCSWARLARATVRTRDLANSRSSLHQLVDAIERERSVLQARNCGDWTDWQREKARYVICLYV
jgi:hypothetical protein